MVMLVAIFSASLIGLIGLLVLLVQSSRERSRGTPKSRPIARKAKAIQGDASPSVAEAPAPSAGRRRSIRNLVPAVEGADAAPEMALQPTISPVLKRAAGQAIVFRQDFPTDPTSASPQPQGLGWFGGLPSASAGFVWPRGHTHGRPLHFLAQIDLAEVAPAGRLELLPDHGLLWLFVDLTDGLQGDFAVIWHTGEVGAGAGDVALPPDLAPAFGAAAATAWPWVLPGATGTPVLPCWRFRPIVIDLPATDPAQTVPIWPETDAVGPALLAAQGQPVPFDPISARDFPALQPPWSGFPRDWLSVQIVTAQLVQEADRAARIPSPSLWPGLSESERLLAIARTRDEAIEWHDHAARNAAFDPLDSGVRAVFNQWFAEQDELARLVGPRAFEAAIETGLHAFPGSAADVPSPILARIAARHALATCADGRIIADRPDRMLSAPSGIAGEAPPLAQSHLLLIELVGNRALGHHFDGRIVQFWISPTDLAARRFERAVMTCLDPWRPHDEG